MGCMEGQLHVTRTRTREADLHIDDIFNNV